MYRKMVIHSAAFSAVLLVAVAACTSSTPAPATMADTVLSNLTPFEKQVLTDKYVTAAEEERAGQVVRECLLSHGFTITQDPSYHASASDPDPSGIDGWGIEADGSSDPSSGGQDTSEDAKTSNSLVQCMNKVRAVRTAWFQQHVKSKQAQLAADNSMIACLRVAGAPSNETATIEDATAWENEARGTHQNDALSAALDKCDAAHENAYGPGEIPGFAAALAKLNVK